MFDEPHVRKAAAFHGGDLSAAEKMFGRPAQGWLDLSTGINPVPYPLPEIAPERWTSLPDAAAIAALNAAAADYFGAADLTQVVAAPGTQSLIQWLPRLRPPGRVAIVGPTYGEHERSWRAAGHEVIGIAAISDLPPETDVAVVVNPNNPDGRTDAPGDLAELAAALGARGGWLVVDEAFVDPVPELSAVPFTGSGGLIVLRSFGKFFGLAGLRLGFAVCAPGLAETIGAAIGPWAVSGAAIEVAMSAYRDNLWVERTRERLAADQARLDALLGGSGLEVIGGTRLFRLTECPDSEALFARLGRAGIYLRVFPERTGWLRFGLPGREDDFGRLAMALDRGL